MWNDSKPSLKFPATYICFDGFFEGFLFLTARLQFNYSVQKTANWRTFTKSGSKIKVISAPFSQLFRSFWGRTAKSEWQMIKSAIFGHNFIYETELGGKK